MSGNTFCVDLSSCVCHGIVMMSLSSLFLVPGYFSFLLSRNWGFTLISSFHISYTYAYNFQKNLLHRLWTQNVSLEVFFPLTLPTLTPTLSNPSSLSYSFRVSVLYKHPLFYVSCYSSKERILVFLVLSLIVLYHDFPGFSSLRHTVQLFDLGIFMSIVPLVRRVYQNRSSEIVETPLTKIPSLSVTFQYRH